jgi:hypothetical protein
MAKKSRKQARRQAPRQSPARTEADETAARKPPSRKPSTRKPAYRDDEPPKGPWGSFPVTELTVLAGLILLIVGLITNSLIQVVIGLLLGSAGGLELSIREHFAGYRSHTTLLAGVVFCVVSGLAFFLGGMVLWQALVLGIGSFALCFWAFRRAFQKVSGGLSYRLR